MATIPLVRIVGCCLLLAMWVANGGPAVAQVTGGSPVAIPGLNVPNQNLTPQQMQSIMMMRALQSRGRGRVQTGVPQDINFGPPGVNQAGQGGMVPVDDSGNSTSATRKSSTQKRIDARKAQEEKKQAARDAAKAKQLAGNNNGKPEKKAKPEKKVSVAKQPLPAKKAKAEDAAE